jgi:DNA-binding LacI/PurR family transcriptional regulator
MTPGNPYHGDLVEEIQAVADDRGYEVLLATVTRSHDEQRSIETLVDSNCEALILPDETRLVHSSCLRRTTDGQREPAPLHS